MFPGLLPSKLTKKSTLRVFRPVVPTFERGNFDYTAQYSAKVYFIDFESQNFVKNCQIVRKIAKLDHFDQYWQGEALGVSSRAFRAAQRFGF